MIHSLFKFNHSIHVTNFKNYYSIHYLKFDKSFLITRIAFNIYIKIAIQIFFFFFLCQSQKEKGAANLVPLLGRDHMNILNEQCSV